MAVATIAPSARPTRMAAFAPRRANAMSPAGSFHGRVRPQRCHSAITASTSASAMGEIVRLNLFLSRKERRESFARLGRPEPLLERRRLLVDALDDLVRRALHQAARDRDALRRQ